jgi:hypothetical protein
LGLSAIRLLSLIATSFLSLTPPHLWRQIDTLSVSLRYYLRWFVESGSPLFLPAVLNSGDSLGIMPMEFPLLNILFAPAFGLGPYYGKVLCLIAYVLFVFGFSLWNALIWKDK